MKRCKDCPKPGVPGVDGEKALQVRPAPYPGPRCFTHHLARQKALKTAAQERRDVQLYGLRRGGYALLLREQNGVCAICMRATGRTRRLCVDHDHETGVVRGLLCSTCNKILGHARDDQEFFRRAMNYLEFPPAERAFGDEADS